MIEITKVIEWDMGHRVPSHQNKCKNPHGHRYRLEVTVNGEIDAREGSASQGMILDFADLKAMIKDKVHNRLDHSFMIYEGDVLMCDFFKSTFSAQDYILVPFVPTAENIVQWCADEIKKALPDSLNLTRARLFETPNSWADYISR